MTAAGILRALQPATKGGEKHNIMKYLAIIALGVMALGLGACASKPAPAPAPASHGYSK